MDMYFADLSGVAYQLIEDDPLANTEQCQRDAQLMQKLGANSIRIYHVNATADHSGCMNAFAAVGIYAWIDLDSFKTYVRLVSVEINLKIKLTMKRQVKHHGLKTSRIVSELLWTIFNNSIILLDSSLAMKF